MTRPDAKPAIDLQPHGRADVLAVMETEIYAADVTERVSRAMRQAIDSSTATAFIMDLSRVTYLTSGALGMVINLRAHLADRGYVLALAGAEGEVAHIIECTHLHEIMPVFKTVADALRLLKDPCGGAP